MRGIASAAASVSLNRASDEDVFQVFKFVLKLSVFKHDVLEVSFSEVLGKANLVVFFPESFKLSHVL